MTRQIIRILGVITFYVLSVLVAQNYGYNNGYAVAVQECQRADIKKLNDVIDGTKQLVADANHASLLLGKTINERKTFDVTATQEIRRALSTTAHLRVNCIVPDDVMHKLAAARARANTAATSGINSSVSTITRASE